MRAQIVEHQDLRLQRRAVRFAVHGAGRHIVAAADVIQQRLEIVEHAFVAARDQAAQSGHRKVRFAGAGRADK